MQPTVRHFLSLTLLGLWTLLTSCSSGGGGGGGDNSLPEPNVSIPFDASNFVGDAIDNPFFPLAPGSEFVFEGDSADGSKQGIITDVTDQVRMILGVFVVVVHDRGFLDGELVEETFDWFAQDVDGNVWYFGEDSRTIEGGVVVSTEGSWEAGVAGAMPGIVMLATPAVGQTYAQEFAPSVAEDRGSVVGLGVTVATVFERFVGCLHTKDFSPLEPDVVENKFYAPGVGVVREVDADGTRIDLISRS